MLGPAEELVAEISSHALPTEDPVLYGSASLEPNGAFEARSLQTFIPMHPDRDNPLWIRVTMEDGFQAWTSPVYLLPKWAR